MNDFHTRTGKILSRINALAATSDDRHGITRTYGSPAFVTAMQMVKSWMDEAGLRTWIDQVGNVRGRLECSRPGAKTLVIGSHIDTVVNAGRFDGPLGVIMGIDLLEQLHLQETTLPLHIELAAFCDEEGVRFHTTFLGSRVLAGTFPPGLLARKDADGVSLETAIRNLGGDPALLAGDAIPPEEWLAYVEFHIEQGPVLYEKHIPAAAVSAIAGQKRMELVFSGMAGHAGTVPMHLRHDALACAAAFILETERFARAQDGKIVATVGKLHIADAAANVIPGEVTCTLDMRCDDAAILDGACLYVQQQAEKLAAGRGIRLAWNLVQETAPVPCDAGLSGLLATAIRDCGFEANLLTSGAGHDAVAVSAVAPVCMLFIRCFEGISHHPREHVDPEDLEAALRISETFLHLLIKQHTQ